MYNGASCDSVAIEREKDKLPSSSQTKTVYDVTLIPDSFLKSNDLIDLIDNALECLEINQNSQNCIDNCYEQFNDILIAEMDKHLPKRVIKTTSHSSNKKGNRRSKPWWTDVN